MSKMSPAVFRLAGVLKLLASDPARSWSLTEIVSELGLSRSTAHALLVSLDEANLVYRNAAKRYSLGLLAASVGRAAVDHALEADLVRRELEMIAQDFGIISVTNYRRKDGILVRDWVDPIQVRHKPSVAGSTIPLAPPWGAVFFAWENLTEQRKWLSRAPDIISDQSLVDYIGEGLREIRENKFMSGIRAESRPLQCLDLHWRMGQQRTDPFFHDIRSKKEYTLDFLAAPVLDFTGRPILAISLTGFCRKMTGTEILEMGSILATRCTKLGRSLTI